MPLAALDDELAFRDLFRRSRGHPARIPTPTRFFTRDQLIDRLHGPGFAVTDRTIDSHVRNLRRKFAELGCDDLIETRSGIGYRLGPCQRSPQQGPSGG